MAGECWLLTSARRYRAMGKGQVFRLYVRNFWSELVHHRPQRPAAPGREDLIVPGYEPFLLCDFHVHTRWSDGRLSLRDTIDLYGRTGKFDVIAITDHILMKKDLLARAGRLATLGRRSFGIPEDQFGAYLDDIAREAERARREYGLLVVPGAEITQNKLTGRKNAHIIALDIKQLHLGRPVAGRHPARDPPAGRAEHRLPSASSRGAAARNQHVLPVGQPQGAGRTWWTCGRRPIATTCSR